MIECIVVDSGHTGVLALGGPLLLRLRDQAQATFHVLHVHDEDVDKAITNLVFGSSGLLRA